MQTQLNVLILYLDRAVKLHQTVMLLLPEDEKVKHNEWFCRIENYCEAFKINVVKWLTETEHVTSQAEND